MDEGTAAGPKRNWWSRPGQRPAPPAADSAAAPGATAPGSEGDAATREFPVAGVGGSNEVPRASGDAVTTGDASVSGGTSGPAPDTASPQAASGAPSDVPPSADQVPAPPTAPPQQPLHPQDPYGTPPYGDPGPWAPAPPVQRPMATPAHGTGVPPQGTAAVPPPGQPAYGTGAPVPPQPPYPAQPQPPVAQPQPYADSTRTPMPQAEPTAVHDRSGHAPAAPHDPAATPSSGTDTTVLTKGDGARLPAVAHDASGAPLPPEAHGAPHPGQPPVPQPGSHQPGEVTGHWQQYDPWRAPQHGGAMTLGTPPPPPAAPRRSRRGALAAGAVALALLAGGIGGGVGAYIERNGGLGSIELPQDTGDGGGRKPDSVAGIAQAALPSVVTLHVRGNSEQGTGTGFVLDKQGHILTNNHVVEPAGTGGEISVSFSGGETAKAKVIGRDGGYDLAVVQVQGVSGLRPLALGDSDSVRVGDPVVAIGAPYDLANTVTAGIISAKQRPITAGGKKGDGSDVSYVDALQTDAPINPGNSGGPLVDSRARVIGINSAIRAADSSGGGLEGGGQGGSIGLGFAIPINQGKWVAEQLINKGKVLHPVIGVTLEMEYAGDGARVSSKSKDGGAPVTPGGPGAKAGIKPRDVITKVDGQPVHSGEELIIKIRSHRPGDRLTLTLRRDGGEQTAQLTLGASSQE
ncbi:S1C family serine protease [Streptomyces rimosus]|uniref:S1C family serine protease n=1 Tax=Streptomyces rimosus TaxID=1927 RepID=UPI0004C1C7F7|nr:trypsin-like peptidase domain-containing protein [Streptomyces rimosus]